VTFHNLRGSQSWMALHSTELATCIMAERQYMLGVRPSIYSSFYATFRHSYIFYSLKRNTTFSLQLIKSTLHRKHHEAHHQGESRDRFGIYCQLHHKYIIRTIHKDNAAELTPYRPDQELCADTSTSICAWSTHGI
jgi:hypothetical protein